MSGPLLSATRAIEIVRPQKSYLLLRRIATLLVLLLIWQLAVSSGVTPSMTPDVLQVLSATGRIISTGPFWLAIGQTISAALAGWAIAAVVGVVLGIVIGSMKPVLRATSVLIDFGRSFPVIAIMPIVIMLLGANVRMEIFMVAISCIWPVLVQTIFGARRTDAAVMDTARAFRVPWLLRFRRVLIPSALPFVTTGLRVSASMAVVVAIAVEVLSQTPGVGRQIRLAQDAQYWDVAIAYVIIAGLIGWGVSVALRRAESGLLKWNRQSDD